MARLIPGLVAAHGGRAHPPPGPGQPAALAGPAVRHAARGGHRGRRHRRHGPGRPDRERGHDRRPGTAGRGGLRHRAPAGAGRPGPRRALGAGQGPPARHRADDGPAAGHRGAGRDPAGGRAAARGRDLRHGRREPGGPAGDHRQHPRGPVRHAPAAAGAARRLHLVLLPAPASRRAAGHRPHPRPGQCLADLGHNRTGILLAPATAQALVSWIGSDQPPAEAPAWSSERFAGRGLSGR